MSEEKMLFVDSVTIPKAKRGKPHKNWLETLLKIPVGKSWVLKDAKGISTIRKAIEELIDSKQIAKDEYEALQRTENGKATGYVKHNAVKSK